MSETMPDLTFLDGDKKLWESDTLQKVEQCINVFRENKGNEATEDCFQKFYLDFASAKNKFVNKIRDIDLIMKCRTKGDGNSNFGGQQCAEFMKDIQNACNEYLNSTIYYDSKSENSLMNVIRKIRNMAESSEGKAWNFEDKARQLYASNGVDITLDIIDKKIVTPTKGGMSISKSGMGVSR